MLKNPVICIRGAGDLASGVALRLYRAGFRRLIMLERPAPLAVRRTVSFCEAARHGRMVVEDVACRLIPAAAQRFAAWQDEEIALLIDPQAAALPEIAPDALVDAIMAKKNLGTARGQAPLVIGLGPGFRAGSDVDVVVETNRGHNLGRVISKGPAEPDTGIPGPIGGYAAERLLRAPQAGLFTATLEIGAVVKAGDIVGHVDAIPVRAAIGGVVRGLLRSGTPAHENMKLGDVDPRAHQEFCRTVSEKSLAIGGGVLEALCASINIMHK